MSVLPPIASTPAFAAADLLATASPAADEALRSIAYAGVVLVTVAVAELIANEAGDVLERTRLQEEVREERERAGRVLAHIGDGVFFVDGTGVVRLWNPAIAAVTGLESDDVLGRRPQDVLPGWSAIEPLVPVASAPAYAAKHAETLPLDLGDREVAAHALGRVLRLREARTELDGNVAVLVLGAGGHDLAGVELQHGHGHVTSVG